MELEFNQFKNVVDGYLHIYCVEKGLAEKTIARKVELLTRLTTYLNGKSFNLENVKAFIQDIGGGLEDSSKDCYIRIIRAFVAYCYVEDLLAKDWSKRIIAPKLHRKVIELVSEPTAMEIIISGTTPESFENSRCQKSKEETRLALQFMLLSACRVTEVKLMKGSDLRLDVEEPFVYIRSKGGDTEMQPVPQSMIPVLREREDNDRLFNFNEKTANRLLERGSNICGITRVKTRCHRLRDIFAVTRLRNGVALQLVSRALRHDSVKTTDRYYSNYQLCDIAPVVNNSDLVKQKMSPKELLDEFMRLVQKAGLDKHEEFVLNVSMSNKGNPAIHIDARFKSH
jgi:site-specific recombinase XerD